MAHNGLLQVRGLTAGYGGAAQPVFTGLDLDLAAGQCLAVVGPSGCGKSTLCKALLDLLPDDAKLDGSIRWSGHELTADRARWHRLRGAELGLLLQDHRYALDPVRRVGDQIAEVVRHHRPDLARPLVRTMVHELLADVRLPAPSLLARRYPHQLSGGQRQRACLAAALAAGPRLLLADEPTTALDLLVQRDIICLLRDLVDRRNLALLLVTHDRDLVALVADRTMTWPQKEHDNDPTTPCDDPIRARVSMPGAPCLKVRELCVAVAAAGRSQTVVHRLGLDLMEGQTLGLAGESGAGKTTLARALAGWHPLQAGTVELAGSEGMSDGARLRAIQMLSQDAVASLNPRQRVLAAVIEAARAAGDAPDLAKSRARSLLRDVDLDSDLERRTTAALSGGQRQRVQLARALAARPRVLVADEPASSLDAKRRDGLVSLLRRLQDQYGLALLVIAHDLVWLEGWCDRVAVMIEGHLVECYSPGIADLPMHPFARDLAAVACRNLSREVLSVMPGEPATAVPIASTLKTAAQPAKEMVGCPYAQRCRWAEPACHRLLPDLRDRGGGHFLRCPPVDNHVW